MAQLFIKKNVTGSFGKPPQQRTVEELLQCSVINIDKPKGPTSHQVSDYVKKIMHTSKAGHSGTLDPGVTGVQPVAIGKATRITQYLLTAPKEYICLMHLHKDFSEQIIQQAVQKFIGKIKQLPPIKSAVKRQIREREIYECEILEIKSREVLYRVKCQAGTYIRKLCVDIGKALNSGAHMVELRRTQAGPFTEKDTLVTLNELYDGYHFYSLEQNSKLLMHCLQPIENAIALFSKCWILDTTIQSVSHGRDVAIPGISKFENFHAGETIAVMTLNNELVAMGKALLSAEEIDKLEKGLAIKVEKVFIEQL